jgi:manganese/zinc/iron transport system ATP- binding protein
MKDQGKTVVVVHHDLHTARSYFDWMVLLNTRLVASGPKEEIFNEEMLQEAYGGKLNVLSKVGELIKERDFPVREKR